LNDDVIPYPPGFNDAEDEFHISTERRLLYTSMTRARERLFLISSGVPSRYINEIGTEFLDIVLGEIYQNELLKWWNEIDTYNLIEDGVEYETNWKFALICNIPNREHPYSNNDYSITPIEIHNLLNQKEINVGNGDIGENAIYYLNPLLKFNRIEELSLRRTDVQDFSLLSKLTHLKILNLDLTNIDSLKHLDNINIEVLYVDECPNIKREELIRYKKVNKDCKIFHKYDRYDSESSKHIYHEFNESGNQFSI
jgi:hypothetical protein